MMLNNNLIQNTEKTLIRFNTTSMVLIFLILSIITFLFLSKPLGVVFSIISIGYFIFLFIIRNKLKRYANEKIS